MATVFDGSFRSKLVGIKRTSKPLTADPTQYEVVVGGTKLAQMDLGQGVGDLHNLDYTCFFYNMRENVQCRLRAFLRASASKL